MCCAWNASFLLIHYDCTTTVSSSNMEYFALCASLRLLTAIFSHFPSFFFSIFFIIIIYAERCRSARSISALGERPATQRMCWRESYTFLANMWWEFAEVMQTCCTRAVQSRCRLKLDALHLAGYKSSSIWKHVAICLHEIERSELDDVIEFEFSVRCDTTKRTVWRNSVFEAGNDSCTHSIVTGSRGSAEAWQRQTMLYGCASTSCSCRLLCACVCRVDCSIRRLRYVCHGH